MISSSSAFNIFLIIKLRFNLFVITALNPNNWIEIKGVMATIATTPKASVKTLLSDCKTTQAPIAKGKINEEK